MNWVENSAEKERGVLFPLETSAVETIEPLLKYPRPLPPPGSPAEIFLILKSNAERRIEGWLGLTPPRGWKIAPGRQLMIAIRALGTISAEFYLFLPPQLLSSPQLLRIKIHEKKNLLMESSFDLGKMVESH